MRKRRVRAETSVDPATIGSTVDEAATVRKRTDLIRAMARLNPRQRDALWLAYAEGSSHEEIAKILGLRKGSVKSLLFRARQKLAALLNGRHRGGAR